jgi:hypothetical protein
VGFALRPEPRLKMPERRERESNLEKNGMEKPFQRLPRTLAEYIAGGYEPNAFAS